MEHRKSVNQESYIELNGFQTANTKNLRKIHWTITEKNMKLPK